jgi:hypothetical protein
VDVPDRLATTTSVRTQFAAGLVAGSRKLEGAYWGDGGAYFVASFARASDGSKSEHDGQVWFYDPGNEMVTNTHYQRHVGHQGDPNSRQVCSTPFTSGFPMQQRVLHPIGRQRDATLPQRGVCDPQLRRREVAHPERPNPTRLHRVGHQVHHRWDGHPPSREMHLVQVDHRAAQPLQACHPGGRQAAGQGEEPGREPRRQQDILPSASLPTRRSDAPCPYMAAVSSRLTRRSSTVNSPNGPRRDDPLRAETVLGVLTLSAASSYQR